MPNLSQRLSAYFGGTGARIIKGAVIIALTILLIFVIRAAYERFERGHYEKQINALEQQFLDAEAKAKEHERQAEAIERELDLKREELQFVQARAEIAEDKLRNTKERVVTLKEAYETIRYIPNPADPVSCADACRELAAVGYPCQ